MSSVRTNSNQCSRSTDVIHRHGWILPSLVLIGSVLITVAVYGASRDFSFMMDDAFDTTWTEQRSYFEILTQRFPGFGYFRPLPFLIFKASYDLLGEHNTTVLRTILLTGHVLASWFLYLLVRRLIQSEWALAAWALFLLFPFSYQTLSVIGAIGHVLVTMLLLGALLFWYEGRRIGTPWRMVVSMLLAVLASWTMEYGVIGLPLLVGLELWIRRQTGEPLLSRRATPYFGFLSIALIVYLLLWFGSDRPESDPVTFEDWARNGVFWLQVVTYPATRFVNLVSTDIAPGYAPVLALSLIVLIVTLAAHFVLRQARMALAVIAVALFCFLPSLFMLTHEYVLSGPRLLYVVAPAIVTFWALLGRAIFADKRLNTGWRGAVLLVVALTLWHSHSFIERRITMFQSSNQVIEFVIDLGDSRVDAPILMVNVPAWFSFHSLADQEYPIGHLGVQGIPPYVGLDGLYYAERGTWAQIDSVALAPDVSGWTWAFAPHGLPVDHEVIDSRIRDGQELFVMTMVHDGPIVSQPGRIVPDSPGADDGAPVARYGDYLTLGTFSWSREGDRLLIDSEWTVQEQLPADYQIHLRVLDQSGNVVLDQRDYALSGMSAPRLWQPGDRVTDRQVLELENEIIVGSVQLAFVSTGDESYLPVTEANGDVVDNAWVQAINPGGGDAP